MRAIPCELQEAVGHLCGTQRHPVDFDDHYIPCRTHQVRASTTARPSPVKVETCLAQIDRTAAQPQGSPRPTESRSQNCTQGSPAGVRLRLPHLCTVTSVLMNARACATATRLVSSAFHPFQDPPATEPSQDASLSGNPTARRMNPWQGARRQPFLLPLCKSRRPKLQCRHQNLNSHARHALHRRAGGVASTQALRFGHAMHGRARMLRGTLSTRALAVTACSPQAQRNRLPHLYRRHGAGLRPKEIGQGQARNEARGPTFGKDGGARDGRRKDPVGRRTVEPWLARAGSH